MSGRSRYMRLLCLIGAAALVGGCAAVSGFSRPADGDPEAPADAAGGTADIGFYLETLRRVIDGDALEVAETLRRVEESADFAPTTTNRLMYALVLALPGHRGSDAAEAQRRLSALLAAGDALLPAERLLATIQLHEVEQRLILEASAAELQQALDAAVQSNDAESQQRIQALVDENQRLQRALDEATAKLDAITSIEQSILELEDGSD